MLKAFVGLALEQCPWEPNSPCNSGVSVTDVSAFVVQVLLPWPEQCAHERARYGSVPLPTGKRDTAIGLPSPAESAPKVMPVCNIQALVRIVRMRLYTPLCSHVLRAN